MSRTSPVAWYVLIIMLPLPLRRSTMMYQLVFILVYCLHFTVASSAFGAFHFRSHLCVRFRCGLIIRSYPLGKFVDRLQHIDFSPCCYPSYRALTFTLVGLSPTEHTSLTWTHNRTCAIYAYGSSMKYLLVCWVNHYLAIWLSLTCLIF